MPSKDPIKNREYQRKWWLANKSTQIARVKKNTQRYKENARALLRELKTECIDCGEDDYICLDFHHLDPSTKEITLARVISAGWSESRIRAEAATCVVLCSNCHRKRHRDK